MNTAEKLARQVLDSLTTGDVASVGDLVTEDFVDAEHVDAGAERRVGANEGDLQRRQVDHVRDRVLVERPLDGVEVGDVAAHAGDGASLAWLERERQARRLLADVEADDLVPAVEQRAHGPDADRAERAGDEVTAHRRVAPSEAEPTSAR
jgi:hypothetical protein